MNNITLYLKVEYTKIKIKNKILEHKVSTGILIVVIFFFLTRTNIFSINLYLKQLINNVQNTSYSPFLSTIIGAFVGGMFTLLGSYLATKNDIRLKANIRQARVIYAPIFDEIIQNIKRLKEEPFPLYELIKSKSMPTHIYYDAWDRINNDFRKLEVNQGLKNYMELLYKSINNYEETVAKFITNGKYDLGKILVKYEFIRDENLQSSNFVEIIFSKVIVSKDGEYLKEYMFSANKDIDLEQVHSELHKKVTDIDGYTKLCECQKNWQEIQFFGEKYLGELLRNTNLRQVK